MNSQRLPLFFHTFRRLRTCVDALDTCNMRSFQRGTRIGAFCGTQKAVGIGKLSGLLFLLATASPLASYASTPKETFTSARQIKLAFYNTENLYDTVLRPGKEEFTPHGARQWNTQRYQHKIKAIAQVIDTLLADLIGVCEVENESVIRDLMYAMHSDYNYIHRDSHDSRGIDLALFYRPDRFFPHHTRLCRLSGTRRELLIVRGELLGEEVALVWCHLPSMQNAPARRQAAAEGVRHVCDSLLSITPRCKVLLAGDLNATPWSTLIRHITGKQLFTPFASARQEGSGSYAYLDRWWIYDQFLLDKRFQADSGWQFRGRCGIYAAPFLLTPTGSKKGYPLRTFTEGSYTGGFSDHLPVWLILERAGC